MKTYETPIQKVRLLTVLMVIYFALYLAAIVLAILSAAAQNGTWFLIMAAVCGIAAVVLDIYVRTSRARLDAQLKAELSEAGIDTSRLNKSKKRRK